MTPSQRAAILSRLAHEVRQEGQSWAVEAQTVARITAQHSQNRHDEYTTIVKYLIEKGVIVK